MKRSIVTLFLLLAATSATFAQEATLKSLLVSIEKYDIKPLDFAKDDITKFSYLLMTCYNGVAEACIDMPPGTVRDIQREDDNTPKRAVMNKIETWCKLLTANDTAILYLAGHGEKDANGKLYLAMINYNPHRKNFDTAAIPMEWIRDRFGEAKGKHKLLLIDTCFSGTAKNIGFERVTGAESGAVFADLKDLVVIASSRENEESWLWRDERHSLFTYWLIEAFKGHADLNDDQIVTCDEIVSYLQDKVPWAAKHALDGKIQNPVVFNAEKGKDFQLRLNAASLELLIANMAEQIDLKMRLNKYPRLAIPEFTSGESGRFDPKYGTLPRWATDQLRDAIAEVSMKNRSDYRVLSKNATLQLMQSRNLTPDDLGTGKTKDVEIEGIKVPLLIDGRMTVYEDGRTKLSSVLLDADEEVGKVGGFAMLNPREIAMMEGSAVLERVTEPAPGTEAEAEAGYVIMPAVGAVPVEQHQAVNEVLEKRKKTSVIVNPDSPYKVRFEVRPMNRPNAAYVVRPVTIDGSDCYLPISKGEEFQIRIKCETTHEVFVRVLVDGLNTLSQREKVAEKSFVVVPLDPKNREYVVMPRASLDDARPWVINDPKATNKPADGFYAIQGFYDANGKNSTLRRFQVVDADESAAVRKNYTDQLGLITIGFFKPEPPTRAPRDVGIKDGEVEEIPDLGTYKGDMVPGKMLEWFNIRYLTPEALEKLP